MSEQVMSEIKSWIKSILFAFALAFLCHHFIFSPTVVKGDSMAPTFQDDDRVIVSKISDLNRSDLVVFHAPEQENKDYIKRVIGLPGDTIEMIDDVLYINGEVVIEGYLHENKQNATTHKLTGDFTLFEITGKTEVPEGSLFVLGDNRIVSKDSRYFGFISMESVVGVVKFRIYPFDDVGLPR